MKQPYHKKEKERERERNMRALHINLPLQLVITPEYTCTRDFFDDWCFVSVTFCQLPLLTSIFWIGLGGSLERPSHSIDLAEMRRYCIMYYQQSYVLILSHEMALFPFTYYTHLNFNYANDSLIILRSVRFQGPVLHFRLRALKCLGFCSTLANVTDTAARAESWSDYNYRQYANIAFVSCTVHLVAHRQH